MTRMGIGVAAQVITQMARWQRPSSSPRGTILAPTLSNTLSPGCRASVPGAREPWGSRREATMMRTSIGSKGTVVALLAIFGACFGSIAFGGTSTWSRRVGFLAASDGTYFCEPTIEAGSPQHVHGRLKLIPSQSDASIQDNI